MLTRNPKVWVLVIETGYGPNTWVFRSEESANRQLLQYVEEWWGDLPGEDAFPEPQEAIAHYFENNEEESYSLTQTDIAD